MWFDKPGFIGMNAGVTPEMIQQGGMGMNPMGMFGAQSAVYDQQAANYRNQLQQQMNPGMFGPPQMQPGGQMVGDLGLKPMAEMPQGMAQMDRGPDERARQTLRDTQNMQQMMAAKRQSMMQRSQFGSRPIQEAPPRQPSPMSNPMAQNQVAQNRQRMMTARRPQGPGSRMVY